jgi:hypothetical protein
VSGNHRGSHSRTKSNRSQSTTKYRCNFNLSNEVQNVKLDAPIEISTLTEEMEMRVHIVTDLVVVGEFVRVTCMIL